MTEIITFVTTQPSWTIIILLVIYIILEKFGIINVMNLIRGTQKKKYPKLEEGHMEIMQVLHDQNKVLAQQNEKFATNHMMHEIPDIKKEVSEIKTDLKEVIKVQIEQGINIATLLERSKK
jgi:hypothetical protein